VNFHADIYMPRCYSYIRFSSLKQRQGASLDRQLEAATKYAHSHKLVLDTSTYKDLGVSAFRSKNVDGALGAFIEAVDTGKVERGSYLLIESLDRLSRDTVDVALSLLLQLTSKGVVIVTLMDGQIYSSATIKDRWTDLIVAMAVMARANEESATKSKRAYDAIERRKKRGELVTTRLPTWMKFAENRKSAILIPERANIIKQVFERTLKGEGARSITRWLIAEKVPVLFYATEWRQSAVSQLLRNPAAYGQFKGEEGVLPAVVTKAQWQRVQNVITGRIKWGGGPIKTPSNTFAGLAFCALCDRRMRLIGSKNNHYLKCVGGTDFKTCAGRMFPFKAAETALVYELAHGSKYHVGSDFFREQNDRREQLESDIATTTERQKKLVQVTVLTEGVEVIAAELKRLQGHIDALQSELQSISAFPPTRREMHENSALFDIYLKLTEAGLADWTPHDDKTDLATFRTKLKMLLARMVKRIEFHNGKKDLALQMTLTYISDKTTTVELAQFLSPRTQAQRANGTYHRKDLVKVKAKKKK
jgi:DNA invertase Pin-like site-specific DNA recombinase